MQEHPFLQRNNLVTLKIKIMYYDGYHFFGMHLLWWFIWGSMLFWVFATPFYVPGQQKKKNSSFEILRQRFASGQITTEEYQEKKKILEASLTKQH